MSELTILELIIKLLLIIDGASCERIAAQFGFTITAAFFDVVAVNLFFYFAFLHVLDYGYKIIKKIKERLKK